MPRRFLTALDVQRAGQGEIVLEADTVVTPQARELAASLGVALRGPGGDHVVPAPDRGPDALRSSQAPPLPEPEDRGDGRTGVIVTVIGRNRPGILAEVTAALARLSVNVDDISQKMVDQYFHLVLLVSLPPEGSFDEFKTTLECMGGPEAYAVRVMNERVFRFMHRV